MRGAKLIDRQCLVFPIPETKASSPPTVRFQLKVKNVSNCSIFNIFLVKYAFLTTHNQINKTVFLNLFCS